MSIFKKIICIITALAITLSFSACNKSSYAISNKLIIQAEYLKESNEGYGKHFFAFVKNCSKDTIVDYSVAYIGFDRNGNVTDANNGGEEYGTRKITMANILPGCVHGLSEGETEGILVGSDTAVGEVNAVRYVKSAISYIKFKSGKEWEMGNLDAWVKDTIKDFSVEDQKNYVQTLKADAEKAMDNPYLVFKSARTTRSENRYNNPEREALDLTTTFVNISDKVINSFAIIVLGYESGNKGITLTLSNRNVGWNRRYITKNSHRIESDFQVRPQEEFSQTAKSALASYCTDYLIIVECIEFEDGTVWNNDYALQFMMYNEEYKAF